MHEACTRPDERLHAKLCPPCSRADGEVHRKTCTRLYGNLHGILCVSCTRANGCCSLETPTDTALTSPSVYRPTSLHDAPRHPLPACLELPGYLLGTRSVLVKHAACLLGERQAWSLLLCNILGLHVMLSL